MIIPCISCHRQFRLNNRLVKPTGSMVRCSNCQHIFVVYPVPEDTAAEPQRASQGRNDRGNSLGSSDPGADKLKKSIRANGDLDSEKQPSSRFREPEQGPKSILDDLLDMDKTAKSQEGAMGKKNSRKNDTLPAIDDGGAGAPDSGSDETEYADLPDLADIENSIDWSDVRAAGES